MASLLGNLTGAATDLATANTSLAATNANTQERQTLESVSIPGFLIDLYQSARKSLKLSPQSGWSLWGIIAAIIIITYIIMVMLGMVVGYITKSPIVRILFAVVVCALIAYGVYYVKFKPDSKGSILEEAKADIAGLFGTEPFQNPGAGTTAVPDGDQSLLNLQPFAVKQAGYIGPTEKGGLFDLETGIHIPLKAGVRFFTFQIDYLEAQKDKESFARPGEPTLLYRDDAGTLVSKNGADLRAAADALGKFAFTEQVLNNSLPLVVYLHFVRTPSAVRDPVKYVTFLNKVATALEPLLDNHLGIAGDGSFVRQQAEVTLFTTPIKALEKKVIFITNADTSLLRHPEALGMPTLEAKADLDYLVHARVYADTAADAAGVTTTVEGAGAKPPVAVLVSLQRVLGLGTKDQEAFGQKGKGRFVIAMGKQIGGNPGLSELNKALTTLGMNAVPMNMFEGNKDELKKKLDLWKTNKFYRAKPLALQTIRQMPVGISAVA